MHSETTLITPPTSSNGIEIKPEANPASSLDFFDWSSVDDSLDVSSTSSLEICPSFKPVQTSIFKKASRKWLNMNSQNFYSQTKNTLDLGKDRILAGKALQSFENYLSIVSMMYFGDPFSKGKQDIEVFRPGKRARAKQVPDPLSMLMSPLRSENEFGTVYAESWSPKQIAIFESVLCNFGKKFEVVEKLLNNAKSQKEITRFYYMWKKTSHYKLWKETVREQAGSKL